MPTLGEILLIALMSGTISAVLMYIYKSRKIRRKDFKPEDSAKNRKPDVTIGL